MNDKLKDQTMQRLQQKDPPQNHYPSQYTEDEYSLFDFCVVLWNRKLVIFLTTLIITSVAIAYALMSTSIYRAEVLMAHVSTEQSNRFNSIANQFGNLATLYGVNIGDNRSSKDEAIAYLKSRVLTEAFIKDEKLLPHLFYKIWDKDKQKWNIQYQEKIPTLWLAYKIFHEKVRRVIVDRKTGLVTLSVEWKDPKIAAEWAAKLVDRVNEQMRDRAIREAERNLEYLRSALLKTSSVEVQEAIYRIIENQIKTIMLAQARKEFAFRVVDPPVVPEERAKPRRRQIVIIGFLIGVVFSVMGVLGKEFIKRTYR